MDIPTHEEDIVCLNYYKIVWYHVQPLTNVNPRRVEKLHNRRDTDIDNNIKRTFIFNYCRKTMSWDGRARNIQDYTIDELIPLLIVCIEE